MDVAASSGLSASSGKDLVLAFMDLSGRVRPGIFIGNDGTTDAFFENEGNLHLKNIDERVALATTQGGDSISTMSADWGDYDNNGKIDFVAVDLEGPAILLHNTTRTSNHWITLDLHSNSPNHFAYGAEVTARAGSDVWVGYVSPASSYLSSSDPRLHFGLGNVTKLYTISIRWPSGRRQVLSDARADRIWRVTEGTGVKGEEGKSR